MFENDFIMREIENFTKFAIQVLFRKKNSREDITIVQELDGKSNSLKENLHTMVIEGKINEAENVLFDAIEKDPIADNLAVAIDFYHELSTLNRDFLESCHFTENEILEGLHEVQKIYGIDPDLLDLFAKTNR